MWIVHMGITIWGLLYYTYPSNFSHLWMYVSSTCPYHGGRRHIKISQMSFSSPMSRSSLGSRPDGISQQSQQGSWSAWARPVSWCAKCKEPATPVLTMQTCQWNWYCVHTAGKVNPCKFLWIMFNFDELLHVNLCRWWSRVDIADLLISEPDSLK